MKKTLLLLFVVGIFFVNFNKVSADSTSQGNHEKYALFANEIKSAIFSGVFSRVSENTSQVIAGSSSSNLSNQEPASSFGARFLNKSVIDGLSKIKNIEIFR